jgi:predicted DNA-binding WGR domain protein
MTFEKRNDSWMGEPRYFRQTQTRSSSPRFWKCWVNGVSIFTEWGQVGGSMQTAEEKGYVINAGKKNEVSAENYALYLAREKCRKKNWEGYREYIADKAGECKFLDKHETAVDFDNPPLNLCFWKPDNSPGPGITKKAANGKVVYVRKMNGLAYCAWTSKKGYAFLTSRKMLRQHHLETDTKYTWNDRFPHIIEVLQDTMPPESCVLGELTAFDSENKDSLALIGTYTKELTPGALEAQKKMGWAWFYPWGVGFWEGEPFVSNVSLGGQYDLLKSAFKNEAPIIHPQVVMPGQIPGYSTPDEMRELAKLWKWEGFVMVDPDEPLGDRGMNFKGKPDRPGKVAAKVKPVYEDDFIAFWDPEKGQGDYSSKGRYGGKGMESATLWQYNEKMELVYIANVGSGLTEEMKSNALPSQFPQVWHVEYTERRYVSQGDKTNAIDHPRYVATRDDKTPEECINPLL